MLRPVEGAEQIARFYADRASAVPNVTVLSPRTRRRRRPGGNLGAEDKLQALAAVRRSGPLTGLRSPKAAAKVTDDAGGLLVFYGYPAEHWVHLRTTSAIESIRRTGWKEDGAWRPPAPRPRTADGVE